MKNNTITAKELVDMGFAKGTAIKAIHQSKEMLVKQGFTFYANKRLGRVPRSVVSKVLAIDL